MRYTLFILLLLVVPMSFASAAITGSYDNDGKGEIKPITTSGTGAEGSPEIGKNTYDQSGQTRVDTYGTDSGLVTCSGPDCDFCSVIQLANNIITWLITFLSVIAVIALVVAGIRMVTSGGDVGALQKAKETFTNILIGFILVLASWLIVDTILKAITENKQGLEFWGTVECGGQLGETATQNNSSTAGTAGNTTINSGGTAGDAAVDSSGSVGGGGLQVKSGGSIGI